MVDLGAGGTTTELAAGGGAGALVDLGAGAGAISELFGAGATTGAFVDLGAGAGAISELFGAGATIGAFVDLGAGAGATSELFGGGTGALEAGAETMITEDGIATDEAGGLTFAGEELGGATRVETGAEDGAPLSPGPGATVRAISKDYLREPPARAKEKSKIAVKN